MSGIGSALGEVSAELVEARKRIADLEAELVDARAELAAWRNSPEAHVGRAYLDAMVSGSGFLQISHVPAERVAVSTKTER